MQLAQSANQLAPFDVDTLRLIADLQLAVAPVEALAILESITRLPGADSEDSRRLARWALRLNRPDLALPAALWLVDHDPGSKENLFLASEAWLASGDLERSIALARRAAFLHALDPQAEFFLARALLLAKADRQEGMDRLIGLARRQDESGLAALELLAAQRDLPGETRAKVAAALRAHPLRILRHELAALAVEFRPLGPSAAEDKLRAALGDKFARASPAERIEIARWLNQNGQALLALEMARESDALKDREMLLVRLDAMALTKKWDDVRALLQLPRLPVEDSLRETFLARCALETAEFRQADVHWRRALLAARGKPQELAFIARYAETVGARDVAKEFLRSLAADPSQTRRAYEVLIRLAEEEKDTASLLTLVTEFSNAFPQDQAPVNDIAYLRLLTQQDTLTATQTAEALVRQNPRVMAFRATLALARLRDGRPVDALRVFEEIGPEAPVRQFLPGWQAVYAAVLDANGQHDSARTVAALIDAGRLKREELSLIKPLLPPK
jgi:hypothetical protein